MVEVCRYDGRRAGCMSKKLKKLQLKRRNHLVAIVMRKAVQKHKDRKREAKNKGYNDEKV
jgi:hypothetical protein